MAQLALAAVGYAVAGPIGWTVGMVAGQLLFPGSMPDQVGPRVGDLRAQQSQYGAAIPILYGTTRVAGNVLWSTPLIETVTTQSVGGKGGPSQNQTTYSYRVSMAILLGRGPLLSVRRIWANGRLIYDVSASASLSTVSASARLAEGIEFYSGSETQQPDPTMEAYLGVGNVPAYRGQAYLVFSDLQLADYGNVRPNITVEVVATGAVSSAANYVSLPGVAGSSQYRAIATDGEMLVALDFGSPQRVCRSRDNGLTWSELASVTAIVANGLDIGYHLGLWIVPMSAGLAYSQDSVAWTYVANGDGGASGPTRVVASNGTRVVIISDQETRWTTSTNGTTWQMQTVAAGNWRGVCWSGTHFVAFTDNGTIARSATGLPGSWEYTSVGVAGSGWVYIASSGGVLLIADSVNVRFARSTDHGLTWTIVGVATTFNCVVWGGEFFVAMNRTNLTNAHARSRDGLTWEYFNQTQTSGVRGMCAKDGIFYGVNNSGTPGDQRVTILRFDITTPAPVALSSIVSDICTQSGLTAGDITVSALTEPVDGYAIAQRMSARAALETLQRAFAFDMVESDNRIVARVRGGAPVMALLASDLGAVTAGDSAVDDLAITRQQETELPADVSVVYVDRDADHQQNTQRATRVTTRSTQQSAVELAIVLSPSRARAIAEMLLYEAWTQRLRFMVRLSRAYAALEPADVVTLSRDGATYTMRIVKKVESRSGVLQFEAVAEEQSVYTQSVVGGAGPAGQTSVQLAPSTLWVPLDAPALRDQDMDSGFYAAAAGVTGGWRGTSVYRSSDGGATYDEAGAMVSPAAIGITVGSLWNQNYHPNVFDEGTLVNVELMSGALSSAAEATVLEGANYLLIGSEVVQFKSAVLYATNTYQLSGLLRGRRGTEWAMSGHAASGERVVLLTAAALRRFTSDLSASRLYKPVTIGRNIQETPAQAFTYTGVNQMPFAPVQLGAGRNAANDITLTWLRRSRQGLTLPWNYDPPVAETSLLYDVEVWNAAFGTLRRTYSNLTTETVTYTAAQQAADSGGVLASYGVRVFQRNAVMGRGYVLQGVI
jgi:hypothetical protein